MKYANDDQLSSITVFRYKRSSINTTTNQSSFSIDYIDDCIAIVDSLAFALLCAAIDYDSILNDLMAIYANSVRDLWLRVHAALDAVRDERLFDVDVPTMNRSILP